MRSFIFTVLAGAIAAKNNTSVLLTPTTSKGTDIAVVWIVGQDQEPSDYEELAVVFQIEA
jgi:hypothetical protein